MTPWARLRQAALPRHSATGCIPPTWAAMTCTLWRRSQPGSCCSCAQRWSALSSLLVTQLRSSARAPRKSASSSPVPTQRKTSGEHNRTSRTPHSPTVSGEHLAMLVDASVARSFAVIGWTHRLLEVCSGTILVADGVHGQHPGDPSELRSIHAALQLQADQAGPGSGLASRAVAAVHGLDRLLTLAPDRLIVLAVNPDELELAIRLQSRRPEDRAWRQSLGAKSRRLDAGESASIAIAAGRSLAFASDDEDALTLWTALVGSSGHRTRDLLRQLVSSGSIEEDDARDAYYLLQTDDLHNLGGPP